MKESQLYRLAELAVLNSDTIYASDKLDVLRLLFAQEDTALWMEKTEEENKEKDNG